MKKPVDVKIVVAQKIAPLAKRVDAFGEVLKEMQETLRAIQKRLNVSPESPEAETVNANTERESLEIARQLRAAAFEAHPFRFPENRRQIERVFTKRGWKEGDTVESVLKEAESLN